MKDKQKRKKERTWAEAARLVLENFSDAPMTPKQILHVIQTKGLKEMSGTAPLACLVTMLHSQVRGDRVKNSIFFKLPGRMSLFTLKKNALQWTKMAEDAELQAEAGSSSSSPHEAGSAGGPSDATEQESCDSTETTVAVSGDNDASVDESSSSPLCSTETPAPVSHPQTRLSRAAQRPDAQRQPPPHAQTRLSRSRQSGRQRKKAVMMPRVVLTPLKVNGEHVSSGPMKSRRGGVDVDFETPGSILVNTNIRALINVRTFSAFPPHSQQQLLQLLPEVDRQIGADGMARLSSSALNNEFFTHASQSWKERLAEGEFTHEMQARFRQEMEKEKKVEAWKEKFFEEYHGQKLGLTHEESLQLTMTEATEVAATVLEEGVAAVASSTPKRRSVGRRRRDGRMRRRARADLRRRARRPLCKPAPVLPPTDTEVATAPAEVSEVCEPVPVPDAVVLTDPIEFPAESTPIEPEPVEPTPLPEPDPPSSPSPSPASTSANEDPEVPPSLSVEEPAAASTSSLSSSSSSSSASSPASSPSSPSDPQAFGAGLDSSSSASSAAVVADPLDDTASIVTSVTGTATSSRESSPSASPAPTPTPAPTPAPQPKEQKRRPESQDFRSFPEKRPRLNDQQSFRTTITSVCSEKPQPTTEEPKVPPIRIQLSRIKPPWVKGHPTYQICPRIVPPGQGSQRSGTGGARTLADIKARAQQARAQREAAAAVAASAEGPSQSTPGVQHSPGIHNSTSARGPERSLCAEGRAPTGTDSAGTQLQLPNVEAPPSAQPSPAPSTTSTTVSTEPSLTPSPQQDTAEEDRASSQPDGPEDKPSETTACHFKSDSEQDQPVESVPAPTEARTEGLTRTLTPTSIPDTLPRFGAQGVDVSQKLPCARSEEPAPGVIQHSSEVSPPSVTPPSVPPSAPPSSLTLSVKEEDDGAHSDSTETASDGETEGQQDRGWRSSGDSPQPNHKPVIQSHVSGRCGPTVIQHCFMNGLSQPHDSMDSLCDGPKLSEVKVEPRDRLSPPDPDIAKPRRAISSARPLSTVEANNPLVTQLLQGSLPLEKVLPSHGANRLEIRGVPAAQPASPCVEAPSGAPSVPPSGVLQQQVPVITSHPSSSSRCKPELSDFTLKDSVCPQPSQGATLDRTMQATRTMLTDPSPPHADPCPTETVPHMKPGSWAPQTPAAAVKSEGGFRPSCQDGASPALPVSITKKELLSSVDGYLSGGAMEGLLNMELALARMAKKDQHKGSGSGPLPFQLYGKLPKQGPGLSYTANVSVMDSGLSLRPLQAFSDTTEEVALKCSCRLKAMIMCQGCGAFCHDDCIGPSKLCVSCLVVR
ncbi:putative Polycomb group protein ASXL1 [Periophthalmus magnuspinnatus]|uniref:putative Polycomb group protein ASXL1 n=1 Tax=Periophthalmus magnuspinnatus TaxID=409849 RepID=UPI00145AEA0B|nr:putative Polycomb group protein ASXL1 [Periophthalmus magnuspinnatus]